MAFWNILGITFPFLHPSPSVFIFLSSTQLKPPLIFTISFCISLILSW